jgi:chemotaxis response regulator CheB
VLPSLAAGDAGYAWEVSMRVLVVAEPSLFEEGVEELLRQEPGFDVVGRETDSLEIVRLIQEASLDVLVVIDGQGARGLVRELIRMVQNGFRIRVVEVNRANNTLCHYCGEQEAVRDGRALLDAVRRICYPSMLDAQAPLARAMVPPIT